MYRPRSSIRTLNVLYLPRAFLPGRPRLPIHILRLFVIGIIRVAAVTIVVVRRRRVFVHLILVAELVPLLLLFPIRRLVVEQFLPGHPNELADFAKQRVRVGILDLGSLCDGEERKCRLGLFGSVRVLLGSEGLRLCWRFLPLLACDGSQVLIVVVVLINVVAIATPVYLVKTTVVVGLLAGYFARDFYFSSVFVVLSGPTDIL
jgi:hypothetical protein